MLQEKAPKKKKNTDLIIFINDNFNIAILFIVIIVLAFSYVLVIKPKFEATLISIKDSISQQEQFYFSQKQRLVDLKAAASLYGELDEESIDKVKLFLPDEYAKEKLFGELEDIISQQGVLVSAISLVKPGEREGDEIEPLAAKEKRFLDMPNSDKIGVIQIDISLAVIDYAGLKNLLTLLESHVQLLDIQSISFSPDKKTAQLQLFTYYFK